MSRHRELGVGNFVRDQNMYVNECTVHVNRSNPRVLIETGKTWEKKYIRAGIVLRRINNSYKIVTKVYIKKSVVVQVSPFFFSSNATRNTSNVN